MTGEVRRKPRAISCEESKEKTWSVPWLVEVPPEQLSQLRRVFLVMDGALRKERGGGTAGENAAGVGALIFWLMDL